MKSDPVQDPTPVQAVSPRVVIALCAAVFMMIGVILIYAGQTAQSRFHGERLEREVRTVIQRGQTHPAAQLTLDQPHAAPPAQAK